MKTVKERIDAIKHELRYNSGPAIPYIRVSTQDARMLIEQAEENERLRKEQVVYVGADNAEHDALISKIADMRPTLFTDAEIDYYGLNHSPGFVLDAISDKMVRLRKALEYYADEENYECFVEYDGMGEPFAGESIIETDCGQLAREALTHGEENTAL